MIRTVAILPQAEDDIALIRAHILIDHPSVAERFPGAVLETAQSLAQFPESGKLVEVDAPLLRTLRFVRVRGFPNINLYYRVLPKTIDIVRVLHGARDVMAIIARE